MVEELHSRGFDEPAEGHDPAATFAIVSAGLLVLGGLALARRRRGFGLLAIVVSVAVYLLRPKPAVAERAAWAPFEEPLRAASPEPELSIPEDPEPEPEELLPAARGGGVADDEPNGWHVIAEAREEARTRVESSRPFVLIQSDESEQTDDVADEDGAVHADVVQAEVEQREPVEGVVNRVELYSRRPDSEPEPVALLEPLEADGS